MTLHDERRAAHVSPSPSQECWLGDTIWFSGVIRIHSIKPTRRHFTWGYCFIIWHCGLVWEHSIVLPLLRQSVYTLRDHPIKPCSIAVTFLRWRSCRAGCKMALRLRRCLKRHAETKFDACMYIEAGPQPSPTAAKREKQQLKKRMRSVCQFARIE